MDYLLGGWQLSNTTNWSSGLPWTPSFGECGNEQDAGICRPNKQSGSFHLGPGSLQHTATGTPFVPFFTPLAAMAYPDPNTLPLGTDACTLSRPAAGPFV